MSGLTPGFADPVPAAQACFRALLEAMARPGRVHRLAGLPEAPAPLAPAAAAMLLTLADAETPLWTDAGPVAEEWLRFHAGCPLVAEPGAASFLLAACGMPELAALEAGTEEEPHRSATLVLQVAGLERGAGWRLTGPGIETEHLLEVEGLPRGFLAAWAANGARFPRGVDLVLCTGDRLAALPRTTRIEEAG
ncbi:MAG: Alpha-D-ribose 1-methylphosphonate 5-triphosphate synthase subunit PhnH [uncultured Craurococcus sp.]|uniref:Alpha-D-ribose 1-methylphosphonate 5-triphosphate synthase subunit PhnH n=1 Tax=uncultured Craurococcus sp. TaxID=1135998 RepID=A0A6J4IYQ7_9PROT|nr:MAG: Alpha-D-ribose 1-methylphosphonate 5-triphosphate synthase subunit PhnH [uncultured Craurococcus sp.]